MARTHDGMAQGSPRRSESRTEAFALDNAAPACRECGSTPFSTWDVYYQMIVGWQFHPGYLRDNATPLSLEECAELADRMMEIRTCRTWL